MKRQRGRNRGGGGQGGAKPQANANRAFDSQGPDNIKIRGAAQHVYEKYQQLARDATSGGDRVLAENYLQHAEHYFRTIRAIQPNRPASEIVSRDTFASGYDIDFEDEGMETAQEQADAAAAERAANPQTAALAETSFSVEGEDGQAAQAGGQQNGGFQQRPREDRYREPRPEGEFRRDRDDRYRQGGDRPNGDRPQNGEFRDRNPNDRADRGERPQNGEFRDRSPGDRPRYRDRDDRYRDREPRAAEGDRPRDDRPRDERPREERPREERGEREFRRDRNDRFEREDRPIASTEPLDAGRATATDVLRSQDGDVHEAPAFLQSAVPAPAADDAERPRRPRRKRAEAATPEPEEV